MARLRFERFIANAATPLAAEMTAIEMVAWLKPGGFSGCVQRRGAAAGAAASPIQKNNK